MFNLWCCPCLSKVVSVSLYGGNVVVQDLHLPTLFYGECVDGRILSQVIHTAVCAVFSLPQDFVFKFILFFHLKLLIMLLLAVL